MNVRFILVSLLGVVAIGLTACVPADRSGPAPDDLLIAYEWREGSLPPPYHYSYSIRLGADGAGEVTMIPDYGSGGDGVPVWTEPFTVAGADLDRLYATMVEQGLFRERWRTRDDFPVGGSSEEMTVVAGGRTVAIPVYPEPGQSERAAAIYAALRRVVPAELFADLESRRADYVAEREQP